MAIDFGGVSVADNYSTAFVPKINDAVMGLACWLDPTYVTYAGTPFTGAKRINGGAIQEFNGASWSNLTTVYAPKDGPALTGTPTAPTAAVDTSTTQLATTAFVTGQAANTAPLMDGTAAIGTSKRYARQDHVHGSDSSRAPKASPALTGIPTAPTAAAGTSTTQLATTAFVQSAVGGYLPLAGGTMTGALSGQSVNPFIIIDDGGFMAGWNSAQTARTGYLQFNATSGYVALAAEGTNFLRFLAAGVEKMKISAALADIRCAARTTPVAVSYAAALAIDASAANLIKVGNLTGNVTSMTISNAAEGQFIAIRFRQDATGGRTIAVPAGAAVTGAPNSAANKTSYLNLTWNATDARWEGAWTAIP